MHLTRIIVLPHRTGSFTPPSESRRLAASHGHLRHHTMHIYELHYLTTCKGAVAHHGAAGEEPRGSSSGHRGTPLGQQLSRAGAVWPALPARLRRLGGGRWGDMAREVVAGGGG
jgi:hypothetical protein